MITLNANITRECESAKSGEKLKKKGEYKLGSNAREFFLSKTRGAIVESDFVINDEKIVRHNILYVERE